MTKLQFLWDLKGVLPDTLWKICGLWDTNGKKEKGSFQPPIWHGEEK